ncbi:MAG: hypothetical protein CVT59_04750 [Actinobacteria bacterium HGW-Actinobacteria-1]|jgi:type II secretory ATPase GspE/PulE/Tfp pilus assembly ATPase PilB-like protein/DNA-binding response OmpR family regulator|nr:MAG: hypothetical protein CVT59_04750 [Actinobacteria bacterium HGW-Actinobacteria-1]
METTGAVILSVDDDRDILEIVRLTLVTAGFEVITAENGPDAIRLALKNHPALVLLDAMMPAMDGYAVAEEMQSLSDLQQIPIVFLTALSSEHDRQRAFGAGAVDYMTKPFTGDSLVKTVQKHVDTARRFASIGARRTGWSERVSAEDFERFKQSLIESLGESAAAAVGRMVPATVYSLADATQKPESRIAELVARYFGVGHLNRISPREIRLGVLPTPFCRTNLVVPINNQAIGDAYVVANPFNWELIETLERASGNDSYTLLVAAPSTIRAVFEEETAERGLKLTVSPELVGVTGVARRPGTRELAMRPPTYVVDHAIAVAVADGASDVEFEPDIDGVSVGYRFDETVRPGFSVSHETATMLVSRVKTLAGLDINERRRSQRGSIDATVDGVPYAIRVVTRAAPHGEAMTLHLVRADVAPASPTTLGMTDLQVEGLSTCLSARRGLVVVASPARGGKTTTAYTILTMLGPAGRNVMSAESPVEYHVPFVSQQSVDERVGADYPAVIASTLAQRPDVLFVGELRAPETLRAVMRFATEEGLVIATISASSATAALPALEALGATRAWLAQNLVAVIAERLTPLPCPQCSAARALSAEESGMLEPFGVPTDASIVVSTGCDACGDSGSAGRVGVFEVMCASDAVREAIAAGASPAELRTLLAQVGTPLLGSRALDLLLEGKIGVEAAFSAGMADDRGLLESRKPAASTPQRTGASVLLVDDAEDNRNLLETTLAASGYAISTANNGLEAIRLMERGGFDLVLSDLRMPLMDGFGLLDETARKHDVPLMIYSASTDPADEVRALDAGAIDFMRIPVRREVLVARVKHALTIASR